MYCDERFAIAMASAALDQPFTNLPAATGAAKTAHPPLIGFTGKRNVGKSTAARHLVENYRFSSIHAFGGGKAAAYEYFGYLTGDYSLANRMVYGDLKDVPSHFLPGEVAPRHFLERFGKFMGIEMGVPWTLGMEIDRARRFHPQARIVCESIVYEVDYFRECGGVVIRLERPDHEGPTGCESDEAQAAIVADITISARSVESLLSQVESAVHRLL